MTDSPFDRIRKAPPSKPAPALPAVDAALDTVATTGAAVITRRRPPLLVDNGVHVPATLRAAALRLRGLPHTRSGLGRISAALADLLEAEAAGADELEAELADVEAAGDMVVISTTTGPAVRLASLILAA